MAGEVEIRAPAEQTEGTRSQILRWLKCVGDPVVENEPLIEVETDKVTVEIASPGSGTLQQIVKQEQEEIGPGDLLGSIALAAVDVIAAGQVMNAVVTSSVGAAGGGSAVGHAAPAPAASASHHLSPAVRRLLAERGLEASQVHGSGQGGRLTVQDVLTHVPAGSPSGYSGDGLGHAEPASDRDIPDASGESSTGPSHRVPHTATRKRIAAHMVQSLLHTAPHVTTVFEADLTAVLEHRRLNKDEFARRGASLTLTAYFLQATVAAIHAVPEANSRWTDTTLELFDSMHIGIATALDTGLVVPVLRDVQSRDLFSIAQGLEDLTSRARDGKLTPTDVRGGTFTISNHGVSGSLLATPIIINQPQAAILGIGKLEKRPVVSADVDSTADRIVIRPRCYVTLTIDHRVMDGHQANRFLQVFVERLVVSPG